MTSAQAARPEGSKRIVAKCASSSPGELSELPGSDSSPGAAPRGSLPWVELTLLGLNQETCNRA